MTDWPNVRAKVHITALLEINHFSVSNKSIYISVSVYHPAIFRDTLMDPEYIAISKIGMQIARELVRNFDLVSASHKPIDIRRFYEKLTTRTNSLLYTLVKDTDINLEVRYSDE